MVEMVSSKRVTVDRFPQKHGTAPTRTVYNQGSEERSHAYIYGDKAAVFVVDDKRAKEEIYVAI